MWTNMTSSAVSFSHTLGKQSTEPSMRIGRNGILPWTSVARSFWERRSRFICFLLHIWLWLRHPCSSPFQHTSCGTGWIHISHMNSCRPNLSHGLIHRRAWAEGRKLIGLCQAKRTAASALSMLQCSLHYVPDSRRRRDRGRSLRSSNFSWGIPQPLVLISGSARKNRKKCVMCKFRVCNVEVCRMAFSKASIIPILQFLGGRQELWSY